MLLPPAKEIEFDDSLITEITNVDEQHRHLFRIGKTILQGVRTGTDRAIVDNALSQLLAYAEDHLSAEESAMKLLKYPRASQHKASHAHFRRELASMRSNFVSGGRTSALCVSLEFLLVDWFAQHIRFLDRDLAAFLRERGGEVAIRDVAETLEAQSVTLVPNVRNPTTKY